jgi:hypothetical protein
MRLHSRRAVLKALLGSISGATSAVRAAQEPVRVGAIRWDAWYSPDSAPGSSEWYAAHNLDPAPYHRRAPFFAKQISSDRMNIDGTAESMEAEISYAADAGINYWAFGWYPSGRSLRRAWEYYQASTQKNRVRWCVLIGMGSLAKNFPTHAELLSFFRQSFYEKVGDRPLMFVMHETADISLAKAAVSKLRSVCQKNSVGNPYIVVECPVAHCAAEDLRSIGGDAISAYATGPMIAKGPMSYRLFDLKVRDFWQSMLTTGAAVVPNGMTGWDRRPRFDHPPPFDLDSKRTSATPEKYVSPGSDSEIAQHIDAMIRFIADHPSSCVARTAIVYSWNECDEGGSVLCPTWSENGPNNSLLDAVSSVLSQRGQ